MLTVGHRQTTTTVDQYVTTNYCQKEVLIQQTG